MNFFSLKFVILDGESNSNRCSSGVLLNEGLTRIAQSFTMQFYSETFSIFF